MRRLTLSTVIVVCVMASPVYTASRGKPATPPAAHPTTTAPATHAAPTPPVSPIAAKISTHPQLSSKVQAMLPTGMSLNHAAAGFRNQGQFIAALHVSKNLGIPFSSLRTQMVTKHESLGQSIQTLKKSADAPAECIRAEHQADDDMKSGEAFHAAHHETHASVAQRISSNTALNTRVQALLPPGTTLAAASKGFQSESQFLAALHASQDLKIPFTQIKSEMTRHDHDSLTTAIHEIQPTANASTAAKQASSEAAADLKATAPPKPATTAGSGDR